MKQLLLQKGRIFIESVPAPILPPKNILVEVSKSLISTGTEMSSVQRSGVSLLAKAKARPQAVLKVFHSIKVRGVKKTIMLLTGKLDELRPLGYSCTGHVIAVGRQVTTFQAGDRVACAGGAIANHAEVVSVPINLAVKVPDGLSDQSASFVTIGSIALQGVRRADVRLGESVLVIGLGLIGQITVQLLKSAGCRVIGMDPDLSRVKQAFKFGMDGGNASYSVVTNEINTMTDGQGVDATLITASTASSEPVAQAFQLTRKKGRVVVVGAVGMDLKRAPFYKKEQDFLISCSYGPGRYDTNYEANGQDYPYAYVRWTENRNMSAFLLLIRDGKVDVESMVEKEFALDQSSEAYELLKKEGPKPLAIVLSYPQTTENGMDKLAPQVRVGPTVVENKKIRVGLIGVGNFAKSMHIPNLKKLTDQIQFAGVCAANSASALTTSRQLEANFETTDYTQLLEAPGIDAVVISTRHDKHAEMAAAAITAGKHVYLEKPLALESEELDSLNRLVCGLKTPPVFMVGFNRRYAPMARRLQEVLKRRSTPIIATFRVNAGVLPNNHWAKMEEGGGRLRGEACHMVDFFQSLVGASVRHASIVAARHTNSGYVRPDENFIAQFSYEDGSACALTYTSLGDSALSKELVEIYWNGQIAILDDFKKLSFFGGAAPKISSSSQDKGHLDSMRVFIEAIRKGNSFPTPWQDLVETTRLCIDLDKEVWGKIETTGEQ